jgi:hypothetical protein
MKDAGTSGTSGTGEIENSCPSSDIAFDAEPDSEFEERAAVLWDGTSAPLEWIEGFARLERRSPAQRVLSSPVGAGA